jgi:hypothetical protein
VGRRAFDGTGCLIDAEPDLGVRGQLLVDLVVERGTQRRVGGEIGHDQRDDGDRSDREE